MEHLPHYITLLFIVITLLALYGLYRAAHYSKTVIMLTGAWLLLQSAVSLTGFYTLTDGLPPRLGLLIIPPVLLILLVFETARGRRALDRLDSKTLTLLHVLRVPVELVLFALYVHKTIPQSMTFEGHNWDILSGLSAPAVYHWGYVKKTLGRNLLLAWNVVCLLLLANVVVTAILSAPSPFQRLAFEQPNIAILYFSFTLLPGLVVPLVLLAHLVAIRNLAKTKNA